MCVSGGEGYSMCVLMSMSETVLSLSRCDVFRIYVPSHQSNVFLHYWNLADKLHFYSNMFSLWKDGIYKKHLHFLGLL